ncbi:MAG: AAA family ATPase [Oscillospiraceae bacterium]
MLFRKIESLIEDHLQSDSKKILLIDGARQVGKTYIIRHVGHKLFENFIEINMVEDSIGPRLFAETKTVEDFYLQVSMLEGSKMKQKDNTLIFIDEIQAYPHLLTLLKFLSQDDHFTYIVTITKLCDGLEITLSEFSPRRSGSSNKNHMDKNNQVGLLLILMRLSSSWTFRQTETGIWAFTRYPLFRCQY